MQPARGMSCRTFIVSAALPLLGACVGQSGMQPVGPNDPTGSTTTTSGVAWRSTGGQDDKEENAERLVREDRETEERQQRWAEQRAQNAQQAESTRRESAPGTQEALAPVLPTERAEYEKRLRSQMGTLDSDVDDLRTKVAASPKDRTKGDLVLGRIAVKRAQLEQSTKRVQGAAADDWKAAKVDAETCLDELKREISALRDSL